MEPSKILCEFYSYEEAVNKTTGNVYGIYDLNGGVDEFVMGNYNSTLNSLDGFNNLPDLKYLNVYTQLYIIA